MQPLIEEILEKARSKDENIKENAIDLIMHIIGSQYENLSYERRLKYCGHIPERYLAMYIFKDEYSHIANFLSRFFIEENSDISNNIINYLGSIYHADALEPLLDIMIEVPEKLDEEWIGTELVISLEKLLGRSRRASKRKLKKLLKAKSPIPFFERWAKSDDPEIAKAGNSWLEYFKDDYGIVK